MGDAGIEEVVGYLKEISEKMDKIQNSVENVEVQLSRLDGMAFDLEMTLGVLRDVEMSLGT